MCSTIDSDVRITINISELVNIRSVAMGLENEMTLEQIEDLANELRLTLTWDSLYYMVDSAILDYLDKPNPNAPQYGTIETGVIKEPEFEMVDLVSPSWTIKVPRRIKKR